MSSAVKDHTDSMLADAWLCSECGELTYDAADFEPPKYCCRCGAEFIAYDGVSA